MSAVVDFLFRVHGDCVRAGYGYQLLAALKSVDNDLASDRAVYWGPLEGVRDMGHGYLGIRKDTRWRVRAPLSLAERLWALIGQRLIVGAHVINIGEPYLNQLRPSPELYAECVCVRSLNFNGGRTAPDRREFCGWITDKLKRNFGVIGYCQIGRERQIHMGKHPVSRGWAIGVLGLTDDQALEIQRDGIGGRRHMGCTLFLPGQLPAFAAGDNHRLLRVT